MPKFLHANTKGNSFHKYKSSKSIYLLEFVNQHEFTLHNTNVGDQQKSTEKEFATLKLYWTEACKLIRTVEVGNKTVELAWYPATV